MKSIFILEDNCQALGIISILEKHGYTVDYASNLLDTIWHLEINPERKKYDAILLDVSVEGVKIDSTKFGVSKEYNDPLNMNGYLYFLEQKESVFRDYEGRIAFYTGYSMLLASRAKQEGINDFYEYKIFDKADADLVQNILLWVKEIEDR